MRFLGDVRYAGRVILKSPGFAIVAVLTLALGIGATVASFSLLEAVLWHWLPYSNIDRLLVLGQADKKTPESYEGFSGPDYLAVRALSHSYSDVAAQQWSGSHNLLGSGEPQHVWVDAVSSNLFRTLGIHAALGRVFSEAEEKSANSAVLVLTYKEWRTQFNGNPKVVGTSITLDEQPRTIIGVLEPKLRANNADLFIPLANDSAEFLDQKVAELTLVGRLLPGKTRADAKADLDSIIAGRTQHGSERHNDRVGFTMPAAEFNGTTYYERRIFLFIGVAVLVLFTACVNVASLLLARSVERQTEFAVRSALGAGRWALVRQMLAESLVLAIAAAIGGILLAIVGIRTLTAFASPAGAEVIPQAAILTIDGRALAFALAVAVITALVFGCAPALLASKVDPDKWLKSGGRSQTGSRARQRWRDALVLTEVALALVLTVAGGLFARSLRNLEHADLGFNPDHLLTLNLWLRGPRYAQPGTVGQFYESLVQQTRAIPGVQEVTVANQLPLTSGWPVDFTVLGGSPVDTGGLRDRRAVERSVAADYFRIMGIPVLHGRGIGQEDTGTSSRVVVINQNLARQYFGSTDPLGRQLKLELRSELGPKVTDIAEIIGVVGNVKEVGINEAAFNSIYVPFAQHPEAEAFLAVRSNADTQEITKLIRKEIAALDPTEPVFGLPTMKDRIADALAADRFNTTAVTVLSALALLLALVGIYAMIAYTVSQRVHEIGIRMALGATGTDVLCWIVSRAVRLVVGGVIAGTAVALVVGRLLGDSLYLVEGKHNGMLYGVTLHDPLTVAASAVLLGIIAFAASYAPARRATKVDPMEALRCE